MPARSGILSSFWKGGWSRSLWDERLFKIVHGSKIQVRGTSVPAPPRRLKRALRYRYMSRCQEAASLGGPKWGKCRQEIESHCRAGPRNTIRATPARAIEGEVRNIRWTHIGVCLRVAAWLAPRRWAVGAGRATSSRMSCARRRGCARRLGPAAQFSPASGAGVRTLDVDHHPESLTWLWLSVNLPVAVHGGFGVCFSNTSACQSSYPRRRAACSTQGTRPGFSLSTSMQWRELPAGRRASPAT